MGRKRSATSIYLWDQVLLVLQSDGLPPDLPKELEGLDWHSPDPDAGTTEEEPN